MSSRDLPEQKITDMGWKTTKHCWVHGTRVAKLVTQGPQTNGSQ